MTHRGGLSLSIIIWRIGGGGQVSFCPGAQKFSWRPWVWVRAPRGAAPADPPLRGPAHAVLVIGLNELWGNPTTKHSVSKGDKKKKKEIAEQITKLEADLHEKHELEMKELKESNTHEVTMLEI
jgi:hypothetical protein